MAAKPNATVCGVPVFLGGPIVDYEKTVRTGTGEYGHRRTISKPAAAKLIETVHGQPVRLKRGQHIKLCEGITLERSAFANEYYVRKHGPGDMAGAKKRRR